MALIRSMNIEGVEYEAAYSRVLMVRCDKQDAYIFVNTYADIDARLREDFPIFQEEIVVPLSKLAGELFPNAYAHLKTQAGFEMATDHPAADPADL